MASLTQYTGGFEVQGSVGATVQMWVGTEDEYNAITDLNAHTLYFITVNPEP